MATPEQRQKTAIIYVRVKPEVKALLEAQAHAQGRTLTNYLEWLAVQHAQPQPAQHAQGGTTMTAGRCGSPARGPGKPTA